MKEVERVSIGGFAFTLDDDAAALAGEYLGELETYYKPRAGGSEILEGIEERMAELLQEKPGKDCVVSRADIEAIIAILGRPEQIEAEEAEGDSGSQPGTSADTQPGTTENNQAGTTENSQTGADPGSRPRRKLYRDLTNKAIAGVCSGLGAYFRQDTALFRILFVLFTAISLFVLKAPDGHGPLGISIRLSVPILYLLLWICMPPAKTVQQRWEQRGENGTVQGIQQSIESGAREIGDALQAAGQSPAWQRLGGFIEKFIGLALLLVGFSGLFASGVLGFGSGFLGHGRGLFGLGALYHQGLAELQHFSPSLSAALLQPGLHVLLMLVVFLPFLGLLYGGLQMLFGFKAPKWHPGLVIFVLWLLSIIAAGILFATGFFTLGMTTV